jgi:hydroxymethylglutaryl-CoA reductase
MDDPKVRSAISPRVSQDTNEIGSGFHRISREERIQRIADGCRLTQEEVALLSGKEIIPPTLAEHFVENVVGFFPVPFGVATHFEIDGQTKLIPMVVEETSIIAVQRALAGCEGLQ